MKYPSDTLRRLMEILDYIGKIDLTIYSVFIPEDNVISAKITHNYLFYEEGISSREYIKKQQHGRQKIRIHNDGRLSSEDDGTVIIKYCGDCHSFYLTEVPREEDDHCPSCGEENILTLSIDGKIPNWYGENKRLILRTYVQSQDQEEESRIKREINRIYHILGKTPKIISIDDGKKELIEDLHSIYPNMHDVIDYILQYATISSFKRSREFSFRPILLVGSPGCGKTAFTKDLCSIIMGVNPIKIDLGNDVANFSLTGSDCSYKNSHCGLIAQSLIDAGDSLPIWNPVILFDELDKIKIDHTHSVETVFYALLEKSNSRSFFENFLGTNIDVSGINYIFTANELNAIPAPILNRLRIFHIKDYTVEQLRESVIDSIYFRWMTNNDINPEFLPDSLSDYMKELILEESHNDTRSIEDAITKVFIDTMTRDQATNQEIALFSPEEIYHGWKAFSGKRSISGEPWLIPNSFLEGLAQIIKGKKNNEG